MSGSRGSTRISHYINCTVFTLIAAIMLSSCAAPGGIPSVYGIDAFHMAVETGNLAQIDRVELGEAEYSLAEVAYGDIIQSYQIRVDWYITRRQIFSFDHDNLRLAGVYAQVWQPISEGDVLAEAAFGAESLLNEREKALLRLERFEHEFNINEGFLLDSLEALANAYLNAEGAEAGINFIQLEIMRVEYERFLYRNERTRQGHQQEIDEIDDKLQGEKITAPFSGIINNTFGHSPGDLIRLNDRVVGIIDDSAIMFWLYAPKEAVRFGDTFTIRDNASGLEFEARVASDPIVNETPDAQFAFVLAPMDEDGLREVMAGMGLTFQDMARNPGLFAHPSAARAMNVLVVPTRAILQEEGTSYTYIFEDGIIRKRYVITGLSSDNMVQILSGLDPGQRVVVN